MVQFDYHVRHRFRHRGSIFLTFIRKLYQARNVFLVMESCRVTPTQNSLQCFPVLQCFTMFAAEVFLRTPGFRVVVLSEVSGEHQWSLEVISIDHHFHPGIFHAVEGMARPASQACGRKQRPGQGTRFGVC